MGSYGIQYTILGGFMVIIPITFCVGDVGTSIRCTGSVSCFSCTPHPYDEETMHKLIMFQELILCKFHGTHNRL